MNMFKPTSAKTPTEYLDVIAEPRRSEVKRLHQLIQKLTKDKGFILSGMIGYVPFHYKYASGREGDWSVIALASQKNYISVYICATNGKEYIAEKNKQLFPNANIGKSCIRFKKLADIDLKNLEKVIIQGINASEKSL